MIIDIFIQIITGDKALTAIRDYMSIKIVNPKDFLSSHRKFKRKSVKEADANTQRYYI